MSGPAGPAPARAHRDRLLERRRERSPAEAALTLAWLLPVALTAVYLVLFLARLPQNIADILWDSDYSSGFTLTQTLARVGDGGHTVISTTGAYLPLWFGLLTAHLPLHRQLWEISPTLLTGATALTIGWSVTRVACRRAGALAVAIILVASPWTLAILMAPVAHNTAYPTTALLGAYLLWLARGVTRRRRTTIAVVFAAALVLGVAIASDALVIATGVVPFALTAVLAAMQSSPRARAVGLPALASVIGSVPVALVTHAIMAGRGYATVPSEPPLELAALSRLPRHARILAEGLRELSNGYLGTKWPGRLHVEVGVACDAVLVAALLALLYCGTRAGIRFARRRGADAELCRLLHAVYWFGSALVVCGAFVLTTAPGTDTQKHEAYYLTLIFSVAAVVPLLRVRSPARWLLPAGFTIFALGSIIGLERDYLETMRPPVARYASTIAHLAEADHATVGYAGYWDASSLTWNSQERIRVRPLEACANPAGAQICPFFLMRTPSWYVPQSRRSFLLVDPGETFVVSLPAGLGNPIASYTVGAIAMYVYPYDIASRLGPPPDSELRRPH
jgi:hypothetical protein